jgi:hypothetical protein
MCGGLSSCTGARTSPPPRVSYRVKYELCYREEKERSEDKNAGTRHPFPPIPAPTLTPKKKESLRGERRGKMRKSGRITTKKN